MDMTFPVGESSIYYFAPFVWSNGGDLVSEDGLTVDGYFNSDQTVEAFQFFRNVVEKEYMSEAPIDICLKAAEQRLSLTEHGRSILSTRATRTSTWAWRRM